MSALETWRRIDRESRASTNVTVRVVRCTLTVAQAKRAMSNLADGYSLRDLARSYGISPGTFKEKIEEALR